MQDVLDFDFIKFLLYKSTADEILRSADFKGLIKTNPVLKTTGKIMTKIAVFFYAIQFIFTKTFYKKNPLYVDLQWFAAEDEGRTEEPTEEKIRKERYEKGHVVKSQELVSAIGLLLPALTIFFLAPYMLRTFVEMLRFFITRSFELDIKDRLIFVLFINYFAKLILPVFGIAFAAALFSNIVQAGFLFTLKPLAFNFSKIIPNFAQYFSKTLFSANGVFNFVKSLVKVIIIAITAYFIIRSDIKKITNLETVNFMMSFTEISLLAIRLLIISALLLLVLSIPDYMFQRWQYREHLKMTRYEAKLEQKDYEGDPHIKQRLRARMRELLRQNIAVNVPKADVVITNPTHFAIALEYNVSLYGPRVLAKGEDELALRIKRIAKDNDVPIVENKPLARTLYSEVDVGEIVPAQYWGVIIEILRRVKTIDELSKMVRG